MKKWNFKIKGNPKELSKKLESEFDSVNGLVFNMDHRKNNSTTFKMRKRILYPWYLFFLNSLVVNGKLSKIQTENEADIEISFNQHFLWILVIATNIIVGLSFLFILVSEKNKNIWTYLIGVLILSIGIILWITIQKKYERNIQEYKTLISGILKN
ncbi:DUF423 domain-containing protein [Mariniflexile sp. HMF6888]|uniref:DUF423 domain-containing protein n=1 Tax=Mariniflexile sp. HMF6888 TaxID=3373086 RepID=UPI0037BC1574